MSRLFDIGLRSSPDGPIRVTNPFDPINAAYDMGLGMPPFNFSRVTSLLPFELRHRYATVDCSSRVIPCNPYSSKGECVACRSLGGGECVRASSTLMKSHWGSTEDENSPRGVCIPRDDSVDYAVNRPSLNPHTTTVAASLIRRPQSDEVVMTKSTDCVDPSVVRKDPVHLSEFPQEASVMSCDDIVLCGGAGIGYPAHPKTGEPITSADHIDFDIAGLAASGHRISCLCEPGFVEIKGNRHEPPRCVLSDIGGVLSRHRDWGCPVTFDTGTETGCLCDPATQVRLADLATETPSRRDTDYGTLYIDAAKGLLETLRQAGRPILDACLPRPGVDDRVAAQGYAYAPHLFGRCDELTAFNGGHLMTGGLVRRGAVTKDGDWWSRIESTDEPGRVVMSDSLGGVAPYVGTGSVVAHELGGPDLNDNGLTGPGGCSGAGGLTAADYTVHPNSSLRVVPAPRSGIPGLGIDALDHTVGLVASQGRVYPSGVHGRVNYDSSRRGEIPDPRGATILGDSTYHTKNDADPDDLERQSPLGRARATHDSGICATAFIVPTPRQTGTISDDVSDFLKSMLPLVHERPLARALGFTPITAIFRHASGKTVKDLLVTFPGLYGLNIEDSLWRLNRIGSDGLGGLLVQPITVSRSGAALSSLFARFGEEMLSVNSPRMIDHYVAQPAGRNHRISWDRDEALTFFSLPPTAGRIVSNETSFFSGRGLTCGVPGTGYVAAASAGDGSAVDFLAGAVLSADSVIMNGFTPIVRPQTIPVSTPPEWLWHERRSPARLTANASSASLLRKIGNRYADITSGRFIGHLNTAGKAKGNVNTYNPPKPPFWRHDRHDHLIGSTWEHVLNGSISMVPILGPPAAVWLELGHIPSDSINHSTGPAHPVVPIKFHAADRRWQQSSVLADELPLIIPPSIPLLESSFRLRTLAAENFIRPKIAPLNQRSEWATIGSHTSGHYLMGIHSQPSIAEESGQENCYPCSGALSQYVTMLVPRTRGPGSHATASENDIRTAITSEDPIRQLTKLAAEERCNCTSDIFCNNVVPHQTKFGRSVAAVASRGNRHSPFLLSSSLPKNDPVHTAAVLMAQAGDVGILSAVGERGRVSVPISGIVEGGWHHKTMIPFAANRWRAVRNNNALTPMSTRPLVRARDYLDRSSNFNPDIDRSSARTMGGGRLDLPLLKDPKKNDGRNGKPKAIARSDAFDFVTRAQVSGSEGASARRQLDFFESSCSTTPSTFSVGVFNPWAEGAGDVIVMYGTPIFKRTGLGMSDTLTTAATTSIDTDKPQGGLKTITVNEEVEVFAPINHNPPGSRLINPNMTMRQRFQLEEEEEIEPVPTDRDRYIMRKIHVLALNVPTMNGFASGQTAAEAALTRGRELWYAPYVKPASNPDATTSMEGIRAKAVEPFDSLSVRDFKSIDHPTLAKICHHHHYGADGLAVQTHYDQKQQRPIPPDQLPGRFPFSCQSDRRPFPPTRNGRIQPCALVEMGALPPEAINVNTIVVEYNL
uniref:Wsv209-like protein n=1 Tax=Melicertus latisulcatus pemonivirus TaxID=2984278 RepID=A0A9C7CEZ6_9VIRU|nr:MAG: wsv209-like protein [Melicertus latisulcatus pemonivirus]